MECYAVKKLSNIFDEKKPKALQEVLSSRHTQELIISQWKSIFGKLAKHLVFGHYRKGCVTVFSDNPMWVNEIDFYKKDILEKINKLFPKPCIYQLRISYQVQPEVKKKVIKNTEEKQTLEDLIKLKNKIIRDKGGVLCSSCNSMYTTESLCIYCKNTRVLI